MEEVEVLEDKECAICKMEFAVRDYASGLSCGHGFHSNCLNRWFTEVSSTARMPDLSYLPGAGEHRRNAALKHNRRLLPSLPTELKQRWRWESTTAVYATSREREEV